jgi:leader peptidase (prepilin peptidase)/N-methyltransferase
MFPTYSIIIGLFIGAALGSFLNVVIYRLPRNMSLAQPPSHCPNCKHRLGVLDLFPLLSFLLSKARCRYCQSNISWRYFFVEALNGTIVGALWWKLLVIGWEPVRFCVLMAFAGLLIACIFIDLYHYIIPDSINALILLLGLGYNAWLIAARVEAGWVEVAGSLWPSSVAGALTGVAVFWGIAFLGRLVFRKDAMGHGDIKLARGIGAVLFPAVALLGFGLAVVVGAVLGAVQVLFRRKQDEEHTEDIQQEEPESIPSLLRCGLGYLLAVDVFALFFPKLDQWWFGDSADEESDAEDDWQPGITTIPFGPYLAVGAILAAIFDQQLLQLVHDYWNWTTRSP